MTFAIFLKAAGAGLALAAPVGPMALLCIRRTMTFGWPAGLATGAGIATGDALLSSVAALGLATVSGFMMQHERALHVVAGPVLVYIGVRTILHKPKSDEAPSKKDTLHNSFLSSALLTLGNPPTLITFAALFTAIAPRGAANAFTVFATVAGVAAGSLVWWVALTACLAAFRNFMTPAVRRAIAIVSGIALAAFGAVTVL